MSSNIVNNHSKTEQMKDHHGKKNKEEKESSKNIKNKRKYKWNCCY